MSEITLIIHGWSDCSKSFEKLKSFLIRKGIGKVDTILYADYESREDSMTFQDVVDGLNDQLVKRGMIDATGKKRFDINVIVHSTGGLVIRHWIWRYYFRDGDRIADCPVKRIVMLAPANFGSPLAHRGKSFLGSFVKGRWDIGNFLETGRQILDGLETASPYQWDLAHGDLILEQPYFNARQIQTTILVGMEGFEGLAGVVNRPGTDGTVVIAGTSLDSAKLVLDFSKPQLCPEDYEPCEWSVTNPPDDFSFGVLEGLNHSSIVAQSSRPESPVSGFLLGALTARGVSGFRRLQEKLETVTRESYRRTKNSRFQQFILRAVDDQGMPVRDFFLEFFLLKADRKGAGDLVKQKRIQEMIEQRGDSAESRLSQKTHALLTSQFHTHTRDSSYRGFLVNLEEAGLLFEEAKDAFRSEFVLGMRMHIPPVDRGIQYDTKSLQNIVLYRSGKGRRGLPAFFYENTTTLLELRVNRFNTYVTVGPDPQEH